jgi:hypothetical protein
VEQTIAILARFDVRPRETRYRGGRAARTSSSGRAATLAAEQRGEDFELGDRGGGDLAQRRRGARRRRWRSSGQAR